MTVTHPEITRCFITIPEAARLVLQAAALAESGQVYVMDMGEPVKIIELARTMIRLAVHREGEIVTVLTQEAEARASLGGDRLCITFGGTHEFHPRV